MSDLFAKAVALEEIDPEEALKLYDRLIAKGDHASACVNAGTICYNAKRFGKAEAYYRKSLAADPGYALAHFDLANVLDDTGRIEEAVKSYKAAIRLSPLYSDPHYNLALAYEKLGQPRLALLHWKEYSKLDCGENVWAKHARERAGMLLYKDFLKVVWVNPSPRRTKRRAKLALA